MTATAMSLTLAQIHTWLPGSRLVGDPQTVVARVHTDSRSVLADDLFVALAGERFDGHDFLPGLPALGVKAAMARHGLASAGLSGIETDDTLRALQTLAKAWRSQFDLSLIAVTGSNGKTTVTQMLSAILSVWQGEQALATQGNFNNHIGVPLTVLRLRAHHRVAVLELGMNHPGEIARLADCVGPTVAVVNNAQREHQEFMHSVQAVAEENGAVIRFLPDNGTAVFPSTDEYQALWRASAAHRRVVDFGHASASVSVSNAVPLDAGWQLQVKTPAGELHTRLAMPGEHNVHNALAAVSAAVAVGVPLSAIAQGLGQFKPVSGRSQMGVLHRGDHAICLVDDTYNANPDSVKAAIDVLSQLPPPRLLVLGDMGEVGSQGVLFHAEAGAYAQDHQIEHVLTLGELSVHTAAACQNAVHCHSVEALLEHAEQLLPKLGSVLVKGSRFMRMERIVQALQLTDTTAATKPHKEASCC